MMRPRGYSGASSVLTGPDQELNSMYDYLAKVIMVGASGTGKSCLLRRFVRNEFDPLTSETVGAEFSSKITKVGNKRIKLQLWDTAGQERFRAVTRSYYRGSAGVLLVYDVTSKESFDALNDFIKDIKSLTGPNVSMILVANKTDLPVPAAVTPREAVDWATRHGSIPIMSTSASTGENVQETFIKLASMILAKIELATLDPQDPDNGVQYGDRAWDLNPGGPGLSLAGNKNEFSRCC